MKKRVLAGLLALLCMQTASGINALAYVAYEEPERYGYSSGGGSGTISKKDYIYYEDFSSYKKGTVPDGDLLQPDNTSITVEETELADGTIGKAMLLSDQNTATNADPIYNISVPESSEPLIFETQFKYHSTTSNNICGFEIGFYSGTTLSAAIRSWTDGWFVLQNLGSIVTFSKDRYVPQDTWITVEMKMDAKNKKAEVYLQSDYFKNNVPSGASSLTQYKEEGIIYVGSYQLDTDASINQIVIRTRFTNAQGDFYYKYLRVRNGEKLSWAKPKPEKMVPPFRDNPVLKPLKGRLNVNFNGEYMFFLCPPYEENGEVYVPARNAAAWYRLRYAHSDSEYRLYDADTEVLLHEDSASFTCNGAAKTMKQKTVLKNNVLYLPILSFAEQMGDLASYDASAKEVVITKGGK